METTDDERFADLLRSSAPERKVEFVDAGSGAAVRFIVRRCMNRAENSVQRESVDGGESSIEGIGQRLAEKVAGARREGQLEKG